MAEAATLPDIQREHAANGPFVARSSSGPSPSTPPTPFRAALIDIVAGTVGGISTVIVGHPLDTVKVRMQTAAAGQQPSMLSCIHRTFRGEGVRGFYKGVQSPLLGEAFFNAIQFYVWGTTKRWLMDRRPTEVNAAGQTVPRIDLSIPEYVLAGGITGFFSSFVEAPIDLLKTQLQTQYARPVALFTTFPSCVRYVLRVNGLPGLWQGLLPTLLRTTPASACYFGGYEGAKRLMLSPGQRKEDLESYKLLLAGGAAGISYWVLTYAIDTVKTAIQGDAVVRSERQYRGMLDCARQLYAEGGLARFYKGAAPCLLRSFPANAACFFAFERSKRLLEAL